VDKEKIVIDYNKKSGIIKCSNNILTLVRMKFSIINPSYQARRFEPKKHVITPAGAFSIGLWDDINRFLLTLNVPLEITLTNEFKKHYKPVLNISEIEKIPNYDYYDYQEYSISQFLKNGRGITILSTGAGKTLVMGGLCKTLIKNDPNTRILIIVPNISLLNQTYNDFVYDYDIECVEKWGDGNIPTWTKNILIANTQILLSDIKFTLSKLQNINALIVDEVHTLGEKKNKINKIIHNINTDNKFGLTGTLPDNLLAAWNTIGRIGPILYEKNSYEIRQQGNISEVEIKIVLCIHSNKPSFPINPNDPLAFYDEEYKFIIDCNKRNVLIKKLCEKNDENILIVVDKIKYGEKLFDIISKCENKKVYFIQGSTDTDERDEVKKLMEKENNIVCIAMSKIFSTGISINNLHICMFAYIGKSNVKVIQTIGRSLRKHPTKDKAIIYDIADNLKYSKDHLKKRIKMYKDQKIDYVIKNITL
jgi:superfamily II DNA or RNA helicase